MRQRLLALGCILVLLLSAAPALAEDVAVDASASIAVVLNGAPLQFDVNPARDKATGRVLVPMRRIFEALGATVGWNGDLQQVTATAGSITVQLTIGSKQAVVGGQAVDLDVAPVIVDGRTLVPLRFVAETLGALVGYYPTSDDKGNLATATVTIDILPGSPSAPATALFRQAKQYKGDLQADYTTTGKISVGDNDPQPITISLTGQLRGSESAFVYSFRWNYINPVYSARVTGNRLYVKGPMDDHYVDQGYAASAVPDFSKAGVPTGLNPIDPISGFFLPAITSLTLGGTQQIEATSYQEIVVGLDPAATQKVIDGWGAYLGVDLSQMQVQRGEAHTWVDPKTFRTRRTTVLVSGQALSRQTQQMAPWTLTLTADAVPSTAPVTFPPVQ